MARKAPSKEVCTVKSGSKRSHWFREREVVEDRGRPPVIEVD